jgi:hypothetical protein
VSKGNDLNPGINNTGGSIADQLTRPDYNRLSQNVDLNSGNMTNVNMNNNNTPVNNSTNTNNSNSQGNPSVNNVQRLPQYNTLDFLNNPNLLQQFYLDLYQLDQSLMPRTKFFLIYLILKNMLQDYSLKNGIVMDQLSNPQLVAIIITLLDLSKHTLLSKKKKIK